MSNVTPNSSHSSHVRRPSEKNRQGPKREKKYIEGPGHYGISGGIPPHKARRHSQHRMSDDFIPGAALPPQVPRAMPPLPQMPPVNIEQIKAESYALGRADERLETREHVERVTELAFSRNAQPPLLQPQPLALPAVPMPPIQAPPAPGPTFLERRPSVRLVHAGDVAHRLEDEALDRLDRLHFDDGRPERRYAEPRFAEPRYESRYEPRYADSLAEAQARRQAQEDRLMIDEELAADLEEDQILLERERRPYEYLRRHDSAPSGRPFDANPNPFDSRNYRRRATVSPTYYDDRRFG